MSCRDDLWVQVVTDDDLYFWHRQEADGSMSHAARHLPGLGEVSGWPLLPCRIPFRLAEWSRRARSIL